MYADYSKIALGYVQLASMCRLTIEIRFSVYHLLRRKHMENDDDSAIDLQRAQLAKWNYHKYILISTVICSIGAVASMFCALWLTIVLYNYDN